MNGGGHYSKVQYGRTNGPAKKRRKAKFKSSRPKEKNFGKKDEKDLGDDDAAMYLTIGVSLGLICVIGLGACSVLTCVQRRRRSSKFSDSNAAIHSKYQDTSLQITGQQQENRGMDEAVDWRVGDAKVAPGDTSTESGVHETSFSV